MFTRNRADRDDRPLSFIGGRASRKEYWLFIACIFLVAVVFRFLGSTSSGAGVGMLLIAQIRRAHDFGRTGWWAGVSLAASVLPLALSAPMEVRLALCGLVTIGGAIIFGVIPGDAGANRFGPPSPLGRNRDAVS